MPSETTVGTWRDDNEKKLYTERARFPLRSSSSLVLWADRGELNERVLHSATMTLIELDVPIGLTCVHVLAEFERLTAAHGRAGCQLGNVDFPLAANLIEANEDLDVATFSLEGVDLGKVHSGAPKGFGIHVPPNWPPRCASEGDRTSLGGFPGRFRREEGDRGLVFPTFSVYGTPVAVSEPDRILVRFEREYWVAAEGDLEVARSTKALGGLSGGPVFVERNLHFEFAGIATDFSPSFDLLRCCPATVIGIDGKIHRCQMG